MQTDFVPGEHFSLPAGTVTFLLTDVESSTRLWEERPEEMPAAIARHYELLDDAAAVYGGVRPVEQGEGDSTVVAFARAGDAVRAAVDSQRALAGELPWVRVRMAVHTGEAQLRDEGNYVGRAIIRCARLRSCAHGGQIVLSASAPRWWLMIPATWSWSIWARCACGTCRGPSGCGRRWLPDWRRGSRRCGRSMPFPRTCPRS